MSIRIKLNLVVIHAALLAMQGCGSGASDPISSAPGPVSLRQTPVEKLQLTQSTSCEAVKDYVSSSISDLFLSSDYSVCPSCIRTAEGSPMMAVADTTTASFTEVTGTNTQESGVDELDRIEADTSGNFYVLDGRHLVVANGLPPEGLREVANINLGDVGHPHGLMLDEATAQLVVVLTGQALIGPARNSFIAPEILANPVVQLLFIDVSDPANPTIDRRLAIDGFKIAARRIGSRAHLVSHFTPIMPVEITGNPALIDLQRQHADALAGGPGNVNELAQSVRETVAALVAATNGEDYVPEIWLQEGEQEPVLLSDPTCGSIAIPDVSMPFALTMVTSVDTDGTNVDRLAVANNSWNVYASEQNLYLMQMSSGWWWDRLQTQQTATVGQAAVFSSASTRTICGSRPIAGNSTPRITRGFRTITCTSCPIPERGAWRSWAPSGSSVSASVSSAPVFWEIEVLW